MKNIKKETISTGKKAIFIISAIESLQDMKKVFFLNTMNTSKNLYVLITGI